jgi:hypothetical protein
MMGSEKEINIMDEEESVGLRGIIYQLIRKMNHFVLCGGLYIKVILLRMFEPITGGHIIHQIPKMLMISMVGQNISASKIIKLEMVNRTWKFYIKEIVYHGGFHFTSHVITNDGRVWFHDDQLGANCQYEIRLSDFTEIELNTCNERQMSLVIYAQNWQEGTCVCHVPAVALSSKSSGCPFWWLSSTRSMHQENQKKT